MSSGKQKMQKDDPVKRICIKFYKFKFCFYTSSKSIMTLILVKQKRHGPEM